MHSILASGVINTIELTRVGRDGKFVASNLWRGVNDRTNDGTFLTPMQILRPPNVLLSAVAGTIPYCDSSDLRITTILNILIFISVWKIYHCDTCLMRSIVVWLFNYFRFFANQYAWLSWQESLLLQISYNIIKAGQWKCVSSQTHENKPPGLG